ncbi:rhUS32 [macacine betaherpesvirus 3]|uniref:RhUS32 n=1 Tax=Rhesus cytomegalovirus (strain 68-1) TaxID=47929 RepID=Q2FA71_RHCM6|nr:rhUS32 [macacine betaherpesvirus 3]
MNRPRDLIPPLHDSCTQTELRWRRVLTESHALWCNCGDWTPHVECVDDAYFQLRWRSRQERTALRWRRQMHRLHNLWCMCGNWREHALYRRGRLTDSSSGSSASSSGESAENTFVWWKCLRKWNILWRHSYDFFDIPVPPESERETPAYSDSGSEGTPCTSIIETHRPQDCPIVMDVRPWYRETAV